MIVPFKDRKPYIGQRVQTYLNLHKLEADGTKWYSLRDKKTGRVVAHADAVHLTQAKFIVGQKGRERVIREKRKNVHAFIEGNLVDMVLTGGNVVRYNPYHDEYFNQGGRVVASAVACKLESNGKVTI